ncbi:MAG: TIGR04283 family arsenosugar biosynthesis glycosyltransferase [Pseudomonadota bacterium]
MSAPLSIVIPTLNAADRLGPCLGALAPALTSGLIRELILADGGSEDAIAEVAEALGARLITAERGRGQQLAAGAEAALGDWLLFLHADTVLPTGWEEMVRSHIQTHPDRAGHFALRFDSAHPMARVTEGWANLRSFAFALPYGDQALLVPQILYRRVGGYPPIPLMEDVALMRRIGRGNLRRLPGRVVTSAERYERDGWLRRGWRNLTTLALYTAGRDPAQLVDRYRR